MTDLATKPNADEAPSGVPSDAPTTPIQSGGDGAASGYEWAPAEPAPKKRHLGLWIGIPAAAAVVGLVAASLVLIAPGSAIAGVPVGGMTPGSAAEAVQNRLAETTVVLTGAGGDVAVSGADLGATVDAQALADAAFAQNPMWNPTAWFAAPIDAPVTVDPATATEALREAVPGLYSEPVGAQVAFDANTASFAVTAAQSGEGVDVAAVQGALQDAFESGATSIDLAPALVPIDSSTTTELAQATADKLNGVLDTVGFYIGDERTVPVDRAVAASWLTVTPAENGDFTVTADAAAIQPTVDGLAAAVNRDVVNATVITDSSGNALSDLTAGVVGRALDSTDGIAGAFATQLADGNGIYPLAVSEVPFTTTTLARRIEVDLSAQRTYLFENNAVVQSWAVSSGLTPNDTPTGDFRMQAHVRIQGMGNRDLTKEPHYYTPDVPYVSYFNGDIAFHGTYWHNNFGNPMSHGCINMTIDAAQYVYDWAPLGTEVSVYY